MKPLTCVAAAVFVILSTALAGAADLYSVRFDEGSALPTLQRDGLRVRHIGEGVALVEPDSGDGVLALEGVGGERIGAARPGESLYVCYPRSGSQTLTMHGRLLWSEPEGASILAATSADLAALRATCFHVHELPASIDVSAWFDDSPPPLVGRRPDWRELAVRGVVESALASVSVDSLLAHVQRLSEYSGGVLRSRYTSREECLTEAVPYIVDRLESYLPAGAGIDTQRFQVREYTCEEEPVVVEYPAANITGTLPGSGRLQGYYIVCAHYDATAASSYASDDLTWWCSSPTPGADDNATGVAVVLETARVLSGLSFPFDVRFVLFSGEELGLLGSQAYAESVAAAGDTIYGVLNVDMVGYKPQSGAPDTCHIVTNRGTTWLADWIIDTTTLYASYFDGFDIERIDRVVLYSDHASFWHEGYDGVVAVEHWSPRDRNPNYHTLTDTLGNIVPSQLLRVGQAVAGSVARLAETDGTINLAVFPEDVFVSPSSPESGDIVEFSVKAHVFGPEEDVDLTLTAWDGEPGEGELLTQFPVSRVMGGGEVIRHTFPWLPESEDVGQHHITIRLDTDGTSELSTADNEAVFAVRVNDANDLFVMNHFSYPNPAGHAGDLAFRYELSREAGAAEVSVFDITGQEMGHFQRSIGQIDTEAQAGISPGWNTVTWDDFDEGVPELGSGVYIYQLKVYALGIAEPAHEVSGRFAVVR